MSVFSACFQGKLASEQHIRELCGSMIDGEDFGDQKGCRMQCPCLSLNDQKGTLTPF